jgi:hypothetical protein
MGIETKTRRRSVLDPAVDAPSRTGAGTLASLPLDNRVRGAGFLALSGVLVVLAFVRGWQAVEGLQWPFDPDHFRNIANAVTFKDGGVLSDAHYAGVPAWYSPLTSALLGVSSLVTSIPVHRLGAQGGAVLNLVTPLALCFVSARWFGRRVAVLALLAYLFVIGDNYPSWAIASYSPWLYVNIYAAGLLVLASAAIPAAVNRASTKDALVLGGAAGIVVLAHPAAALLLAAVVGAQYLAAGWHASRAVLRRMARSAGIALATALVVSAPLWLPIMIRYQGRVENDLAGRYAWPELDRHRFWGFVRDFAWHWPVVIIAVGLAIWLVRRQLRYRARRSGPISVGGTSILVAWTAFSFLGLLYEVYRDSGPVPSLPIPATPSHHFLLFFSIALCMWFGLAVNTIVRAVFGRRDTRLGAVAVALVVVGIAAWIIPTWWDRSDFTFGRDTSQSTGAFFDDFAVVDWIRSDTNPDDKFLNVGEGTWNGVLLPGLAGRKSVNINMPEFSNPFVSYGNREDEARRMVDALRACELRRFSSLAREHGDVRYIITQPASTVASECPEAVPVVYRDNAVSIQRISARRS